MSETDTTKAPWCPRCGGEMVRPSRRTRYGVPLWFARCDGCGFGAEEDMDDTDALAEARRLVRAELARQALEMRAHSEHFRDDDGFDRPALWASSLIVMTDYEWLGAHPLRLPGEGGL